MNRFIAIFALVAVSSVLGGPLSREAAARRAMPALIHEEIHDEFSQYALRYVTAEGTIFQERGRWAKLPDCTGYDFIIEGESTYIGDDGKIYTKKYSSGFDGTKVEGNYLPVAPEALPVEALPLPVAPAVIPVIPGPC